MYRTGTLYSPSGLPATGFDQKKQSGHINNLFRIVPSPEVSHPCVTQRHLGGRLFWKGVGTTDRTPKSGRNPQSQNNPAGPKNQQALGKICNFEGLRTSSDD
jgi:hypothetical protein